MTTATQKIPSGYKQTEIGVIPADWNIKPLGDIGECLIGLTYKPSDVSHDGMLVLRSSNIQNGKLSFEDNVYVDVDVPEKIKVKKGDILICVRNGSRNLIGKCALLNSQVEGQTFGAFMSVFRTPYYNYIFHQFQSNNIQRQINENIGATINQITNKNLSSFRIAFPNKEEERSVISNTISDAEALTEKLERLIKKKKNIKQGTMQELLTGKRRLTGFSGKWETKKIGEIGKLYGGLSGKVRGDFGVGNSSYIPFMNIMSNPIIDFTYFDTVNIHPGEFQNKAQKGDLFFNGSSETPEEVGMCSVLLIEVPNLYLNSFCFGFRLNQDLKTDGLFFSYYFRSDVGRALIFSLAQGATRYNLSKTNFLKLEVLYPKPDEQKAIANVLSDMDTEIEKLESQLTKYQNIKQGMMQTLLTGKIRLVK